MTAPTVLLLAAVIGLAATAAAAAPSAAPPAAPRWDEKFMFFASAAQGADKEHANSASYTPLLIASTKGHLEVVRYLCEQGANKEARAEGLTPLRIATVQGHGDVAAYLCDQGIARWNCKRRRR